MSSGVTMLYIADIGVCKCQQLGCVRLAYEYILNKGKFWLVCCLHNCNCIVAMNTDVHRFLVINAALGKCHTDFVAIYY